MKKTFVLFCLLILPIANFAATKTAIFASGCFWCAQSDFDKLEGVTNTVVGYDGGTSADPTYEKVSSGTTHYVESITVTFDDAVITYPELLNYYWQNIDPTVQNAQFCDHGEQYRSVIFYLDDDQKSAALASLDKVKQQLPVVYTEIIPSTKFYPAEEYHQDYYKKNPTRYHYYRWSCGRDKRLEEIWHAKNNDT